MNDDLRFTPKKRKGLWYIYDTSIGKYVAKKDKKGVLKPIKVKSTKKLVDLIVKLEQSVKN